MFKLTIHKEGPKKERKFLACPDGVKDGCGFFECFTEVENSQEKLSQNLESHGVLSEIQFQTAETKRHVWSLPELKDLITFCSANDFFQKAEIQPCKNKKLYTKLQNFLIQKGQSRNQQQIHAKIKTLKNVYELLKSSSQDKLEDILLSKKYYESLYHIAILKKDCSPNISDEGGNENLNPNTSFSDSNYWSDSEISDLLTTCIEPNIFHFKYSKLVRNADIYTAIHRTMQGIGCNKTYDSMVNKINSLNSEFTRVQKTLQKSGEAGLKTVYERRPYFDKMVQLFGHRPKVAMDNFDSLDLENLVDASISNDKDRKARFPKPKSSVDNILTKSLEVSRKHDEVILERLLKHDEEMNKKKTEFVGQVVKESS